MYMEIMIKLRYEADIQDKIAESRPKPSTDCEYHSNIQYQESLTKHRRMKESMKSKQTQPLTSSQGIGDFHSKLHYFNYSDSEY